MKTFRVSFLILFGLLTSAPAQLLISEYVDANTTRGAIELWNVSGTNVTFGTGGGQLDVRVEIYANGSASPTATIILTSGFALGVGNVFVLGHSSAPFAPICDQVSGAVSWTGNDAIVVRLGSGTIIDSLGQVGVDPGIEWGTGSASTADNTLRRKIGNFTADTDPADSYDPAAYFDGYPLNNIEHLGLPPLANTLPTVGTIPPTSVSPTEATLYGQVDSHNTTTAMWFDHGTTTNYNASTPLQFAGSGAHGYQYILTGLVRGVTYHYRAAASNSLGVVFGTNVSFTTPNPIFDLVTNLTPVYAGTSAWGDYDNDGRLDLMLCGAWNSYSDARDTYYQYKKELWRNDGIGFSLVESAPFGGLVSAAWGDANNDGLLDLLFDVVDVIFVGDGDVAYSSIGVFLSPSNEVSSAPDSTLRDPNLADYAGPAWGDYNNDGKLDVAGNYFFRNESPLFVTNGLSPAQRGARAWGDYDNDGKLDLAVPSGIWRNTGNGFTNLDAGLRFFSQGSLAWGDYDNDGRIDLLTTGYDGFTPVSRVWRNTGSGFTNIAAGLTGVGVGIGVWGDYDNDGRLDILLSGRTNQGDVQASTELWRNTGNGFTKVDLALPRLSYSSAAWVDFDNDGRLDLFLEGTTNSSHTGAVAQIWRNNTSQTNTPPSAPSGLSAALINNVIIFTWNSASDSQTPAPGLTYNMRAGTSPGGINIVSPMSATDGFRRLPAAGNRGHARIWTMPLTNLPLGTPVYWSVQAIDSAFAGSPFSPEHSFRVLHATPPPPNPPLLLPVTMTNLFYGDLNGDGVVDQEELNAALAPYVQHSPFLQMTNVVGLGQSNISFTLSNSTTGAFSVESSTNLLDWNFLGPAMPRFEFHDTNAPVGPQRYYRLRWP